MIRIAIELWPGGNEEYKRTLSEIRIANDSNLANISDYRYKIARNTRGKRPRRLPDLAGKVLGFPRNRLNVLDLLYRVLHDAVGKRNKTLDSKTGKVIR